MAIAGVYEEAEQDKEGKKNEYRNPRESKKRMSLSSYPPLPQRGVLLRTATAYTLRSELRRLFSKLQ